MKDPSEIRREQLEAAHLARSKGLAPLLLQDWDLANEESKRLWTSSIPFLGDYVPEGFVVDSSGFGREDEPALTFSGFMKAVREGLYYAIVEMGEFQVYVQAFRKKEH